VVEELSYHIRKDQLCLGREPLPFADNSFNFATYTDVIEHHEFSPKRVLVEIHRVLVPGGRLILATPNHASIYNRIKLFLGGSVNDEFDYFFNTAANAKTYDGYHREFTRSEIDRRWCRRISASSNAA
jgi:SAM-dependent methyltransferase